MRLYIAGPMTGLPSYNYPAFDAAEATLRAAGYEVSNPADTTDAADGWPHPREFYLRRALRRLLDCDGVALLSGWRASDGARLEVEIACALDMPVMTTDAWLLNQAL